MAGTGNTSPAAFEAFLDALASKQPAPGGGAVAGVVGALASALGSMVLAYSEGKKTLAEHAAFHLEAAAELSRARAMLLALAEEDAEAYAVLSAAMALPKDDPDRADRVAAAAERAIAVPETVLATALAVLRRLEAMPGRTNRDRSSDLAIAADLAAAAARAAAWNIRANAPLCRDGGARLERASTAARDASDRAARVGEACSG